MAELPTTQVPGIYHRRIGDVLVTAISDGFIDATFGVLRNIEEHDAQAILRAGFLPTPPRIDVNCFLVRSQGRIAVVDTGSGDTMGPTLGRLPEAMATLGVAPGDVDTVILTHMHPDHSNGLTAPDGSRRFPEAKVVVAEQDVRHWHDDGEMSRADERARLRYFEWSRFQMAPYMDRRAPATGEVFPGVHAVPLFGHTPGHTGYRIDGAGDSLLIWGDICHVPDIQVVRPEVAMLFDSDPDAAIATRRRTFDMAASDRLLVAGMHLHFPGFAHMVRRGDGYALEPEAWSFSV